MTLCIQSTPSGSTKIYRIQSDQERQYASERAKAYWEKLKCERQPRWEATQTGDIDAATGWRYDANGELVNPENIPPDMGLSGALNSRKTLEPLPEGHSGEQPGSSFNNSVQFVEGNRVAGADPYGRNYYWVGTVAETLSPHADGTPTIGVKWDAVAGEETPSHLRWYCPNELRLAVPEGFGETSPSGGVGVSPTTNCEATEINSDIYVPKVNQDFNHSNIENDSQSESEINELFSSESTQYGRAGRYPKFTNKTAAMISNCAILLQHDLYNRAMLAFVTCTLPNMDSEDEASVNINISLIIKTMRDELRRQLKKISKKLGLSQVIPLEDVGVIELCKKAIENGRVKIHLHFVFRNKVTPSGKWLITTEVMDKIWQDAINKYTSKFYECKCNQMKKVEKNAAAYLAKYISKGSEEELEKLKVLGVQLPVIHSWYFIATSIKQYLKNWLTCHKEQFEYKGGLIQLEKDLSIPSYRSKIKGLKNQNPYLVTRLDNQGEEIPVALVIYFDYRERDAFALNFVEQAKIWDRFNRDSQVIAVDAQRAGWTP